MSSINIARMTEADYERAAEEYCRSLPLEHFMEAIPQSTQREITLESLALLRARRADVQVFNELLVQYPTPEGLGQVVPDNMILLSDKPVRAKGSFNLPFESARPFWVLEYVSESNKRKDYEESFQKYERDLKVPYCLFYYPDKEDLQVYKHGGRRYRKLKPNNQGRYALPELDLEVGLQEGWVRFWYQGSLLPLPGALLLEKEAAERRAEQEARRAEQEARRAEQEARHAQEERERRRIAEDELQRLRALLEQQRPPDKN